MSTFDAVLCGRNDGYGGHTQEKFIYVINSLIWACDNVWYIDWNSPDGISLVDATRDNIVKLNRLHHIKISEAMTKQLTNNDSNAQKVCEVLARNIGIRRSKADFIFSTNTDDITPHRRYFDSGRFQPNTFYVAARRDIDLEEIYRIASYEETLNAVDILDTMMWRKPHVGNASCCPEDKWSIYACPGDFQLASRNVWHTIKGFEEKMIYRGYTDSNVQCKAEVAGFGLQAINDLPVFHFTHETNTGASGGGIGLWNEDMRVREGYTTENSDTWGFSNIDFSEEIL